MTYSNKKALLSVVQIFESTSVVEYCANLNNDIKLNLL